MKILSFTRLIEGSCQLIIGKWSSILIFCDDEIVFVDLNVKRDLNSSIFNQISDKKRFLRIKNALNYSQPFLETFLKRFTVVYGHRIIETFPIYSLLPRPSTQGKSTHPSDQTAINISNIQQAE